MIYIAAYIGDKAKDNIIGKVSDFTIIRDKNPLIVTYDAIKGYNVQQYNSVSRDSRFDLKGHNRKREMGVFTCYRYFKPENTQSCSEAIIGKNNEYILVFDGVIENYVEIKKYLTAKNISIKRNTYVELISNLFNLFQETSKEKINAIDVLSNILSLLAGSFSIILVSKKDNGSLICVNRGTSLIIGQNENNFIVTNDLSTVLTFTKNITYLNDLEFAEIENNNLKINVIERSISTRSNSTYLDIEQGINTRNGHETFLFKEIMEQDEVLLKTLQDRVNEKEGTSFLQELHSGFDLNNIDNIIITGCGTSWCACLIGAYMIEEYSRIPVNAIYASDLRYREFTYNNRTLLIALSQSGETADTLVALDIAKSKGIKTMSIVNTVSSSISTASDITLYAHAGVEIGIVSTKSFISQIALLSLLTLHLGRYCTISLLEGRELIGNIISLPNKIRKILSQELKIKKISKILLQTKTIGILGHKYNYPVAIEAALMFSELSYIHSIALFGAEMKHGPITLVDQKMPFFVILREGEEGYYKIISNIQGCCPKLS